MKINRAWCFFEQSGVFKNEFKKLGIPAVDCDIRNNFNQTDIEIDLFLEIQKARECEPSIFDEIKSDDLIIAFFPCTYFQARTPLNSRGEASQMKDWGVQKKVMYSKNIVTEMCYYYQILCSLCIICLNRRLRLVIENPYTQPHFLTQYFPIKPIIFDKDRRKRGDDFKKPTQYFFINCEPEQNFIFENIEKQGTKLIEKMRNEGCICRQELRSLINPCYANRFIREFLLDGTMV